MIWLSNSTVARLRDKLRLRGQRQSIAAVGGDLEALEAAAVSSQYGPICEAMYLMMSADGTVSPEEREVLRGALRNLSEDSIRTGQIDAMLDAAAKGVAEQGRDARLQEVIDQLEGDPARAEVAFVLAAAIAFADSAIADEENETLDRFAEGLGIDEARANQLLDSVEADLAQRSP